MKKQVKHGMHVCLKGQMAVVSAALYIRQERNAATAKMETAWSPNVTLGLSEERRLSTRLSKKQHNLQSN